MTSLEPEMIYWERIDGPLGPTTGSPERVCWAIVEATLDGPRVHASLAMPGTDWMRVDGNNIRRPDQRAQFVTDDGVPILMHYDAAVIRADHALLTALTDGTETSFGDNYMYMVPQFDVGDARYAWLTTSLFLARGRVAGRRQIEYEVQRVC